MRRPPSAAAAASFLVVLCSANAHAATSGKFTAISFNVAGLPAALQSNDVPGDKATVAGEIGTYFAEYDYDVIHMQEDFNYHAYIYATDDHPYRTATSGGAAIGSGLNTVSNFNFNNFDRIKWDACNGVLSDGNDCLTPKGFTVMRVTLDEGVVIDFYNFHMDADTTDADEVARNSNIQQVNDYFTTFSASNAVVAFGDTNSRYTRAADNIREFKTQSGMTDAWVSLIRSGVEPTAGTDAIVCASNPTYDETCEVVDKMFFRSSGAIQLTADHFEYAGYKFLQPDGSITSDHDPILVNFTWTFNRNFRQSSLWGGPHGDWFSDLPEISVPAKAHVLSFRGGSRLDSVGITLNSGQTFTHGGTGGTLVSMTLAYNEYWTAATLCQGQYNSHTRNFYISATTSAGRTLTAGASTSDCYTYTAPSGFQIVGYYGQDGDEMDQLGFIAVPQWAGSTLNLSGWLRFGTATNAAKCLDFYLGSAVGTSMEIWDCNSGYNQQFIYTGGQLVNRQTGWCLDVLNGVYANGQEVWLWTCNGANAQQWTIESNSGYYHVRATGTSYCLNDLTLDTDNGAKVALYACDTTTASLWIPQSEPEVFGSFSLESAVDHTKCLDFPAGSYPGTQMEIWDCNSGQNQRFAYRGGQLVSQFQPDLCLTASAAASGQAVTLSACATTATATQSWTFAAVQALNATQVRLAGSSLCLNDYNFVTTDSAPVVLWTCYNDTASTWVLSS